MTITTFEDASTREVASRARPRLLGELAVVVGLLVVYDRLRVLTGANPRAAFKNARSVISIERLIGVNFERGLNHWLATGNEVLAWVAVHYYQFLHIGVTMSILVACYVWFPNVYRPARNALILTNVVGLAVFAVLPVAPPRLLPGVGYFDMVADAGFGTSHGPIPMVAYGAMPSLHLAWSVWSMIVGLTILRSRLGRAASLFHPLAMSFVVVATGNHYVLDVVAGTLLGVTAAIWTGLFSRLKHRDSSVRRGARQTDGANREQQLFGGERSSGTRSTIVAFHAHPDDESMLMGGTLARLADEGHTTVIVVATRGEAGLTGDDAIIEHRGGDRAEAFAARRFAELGDAARLLGCDSVEWLGYDDSGRFGEATPPNPFAHADIDVAARRLADLLVAYQADVLTIYDPAGGYGHPDHVQVYRVGRRAAEMAGTRRVLEATADRRAVLRLAKLVSWIPGFPPEFRPDRLTGAFSEPTAITHRVDVTEYIDVKRAAMAAHSSQTSGGSSARSLAVYLRLPKALFRRVFGTEWFVEEGVRPGANGSGDAGRDDRSVERQRVGSNA